MFKAVHEIILEQLGGQRFITMTGVKNLSYDGPTLRMSLPRNKSKANRLWITLNNNDTYTMRFFRYTAPRFITAKAEFTNEKVTEIKQFEGVYNTQLQELFTRVTGLYTHL